MAEPTQTLPRGARSETGYRPISGLALAALAAAGVFAFGISLIGITAFFLGQSVFVGIWVVVFPIAGLALAVAAQRRIRRSDGALGGEGVAGWAWWLSVLFGLGFVAFYFGTYLAARRQAEDWNARWFKAVQEDRLIDSFMMTLDPSHRKFYKPGDYASVFQRYGLIPMSKGGKPILIDYLHNDLVQLLREAGPDAQIRSLGVRDWVRYQSGFRMTETYEIATPTATFELLLVTLGNEGKDFEGRQWRISAGESKVTALWLTQLGQAVDTLRLWARRAAGQFLEKLHRQDLTAAYFDTVEPASRPQAVRDFALHNVMEQILNVASVQLIMPATGPGAAVIVPLAQSSPEVARRRYLPNAYFEQFSRGDMVDSKEMLATDRFRKELDQEAKACLRRPYLYSFKLGQSRSALSPCGPEPDFVDLAEEIDMGMYPGGNQDKAPSMMATTAVLLRTKLDKSEKPAAPEFYVRGLKVQMAAKPLDLLMPVGPAETKPAKRKPDAAQTSH
jgi:hypothetical protein